jgi:dihydrofolate reductase
VAKLIYSAIASLDGYIADEQGNFDWAAPDEEVHAAANDLQRQIGTMLLGRRMYEVLLPWETMDTNGEPSVLADFAALWRKTDKVVYSRTLDDVSSARTRLERDFDGEAVRRMKASADRDLSVGGPDLAASAFAAGLVDECDLFLNPVIVGGGTRALPDKVQMPLELLDERRFESGVVHLHYRAQGSP